MLICNCMARLNVRLTSYLRYNTKVSNGLLGDLRVAQRFWNLATFIHSLILLEEQEPVLLGLVGART